VAAIFNRHNRMSAWYLALYYYGKYASSLALFHTTPLHTYTQDPLFASARSIIRIPCGIFYKFQPLYNKYYIRVRVRARVCVCVNTSWENRRWCVINGGVQGCKRVLADDGVGRVCGQNPKSGSELNRIRSVAGVVVSLWKHIYCIRNEIIHNICVCERLFGSCCSIWGKHDIGFKYFFSYYYYTYILYYFSTDNMLSRIVEKCPVGQ